jgi:hypothetical protein
LTVANNLSHGSDSHTATHETNITGQGHRKPSPDLRCGRQKNKHPPILLAHFTATTNEGLICSTQYVQSVTRVSLPVSPMKIIKLQLLLNT